MICGSPRVLYVFSLSDEMTRYRPKSLRLQIMRTSRIEYNCIEISPPTTVIQACSFPGSGFIQHGQIIHFSRITQHIKNDIILHASRNCVFLKWMNFRSLANSGSSIILVIFFTWVIIFVDLTTLV